MQGFVSFHLLFCDMEELKRNMLICGHPDYEQEIRELLNGFDHLKGTVNSNEDDAPGKTKQEETA